MKGFTTLAIKIPAYDKVRRCKELMQKELMMSKLSIGSVIERLANLYLKERELHEETNNNTGQH